MCEILGFLLFPTIPLLVLVAHIVHTFYWGRKIYEYSDGSWRAVREVVQGAAKFINKEIPDEYAEMVRMRLRKFQYILLAAFFIPLMLIIPLLGQCGGVDATEVSSLSLLM